MDSPLPTPVLELLSLANTPDCAQDQPSPTARTGHLSLVLGPMFSGKTTMLAGWYHKVCRIAHVRTLVVNHVSDQRYTKQADICTHDGLAVPCVMLERLEACEDLPEYKQTLCILINEVQFFASVDWVLRAVEEHGKMVVCFGLDGDFQRRSFSNGWLEKLLPVCDTVTKLHALCTSCKKRSAPFSMRLDQTNTEQLSVGGAEAYAPRCRACWLAEARK